MMDAEILSIGTELLDGSVADENGPELGNSLRRLGFRIKWRAVVGDNPQDLEAALRLAISRASLVLTTGGLGGAEDDFTRKAVSLAAGRRLILNEKVPDRQALIPARARILNSSKGSGFGFALHIKEGYVICLPGDPGKMKEILREAVIPFLSDRFKRLSANPGRILRSTGLTESELRGRLADLLSFEGTVDIRVQSVREGVDIHLEARGWPEGERPDALEAVSGKIRDRLGDSVYGQDDESLESVVGRLLVEGGSTLSVAESCTGGLIGNRLTDVPGSSAFLDHVSVCYSNRSKVEMLGVPADVIRDSGAVSEATAAALAKGVRQISRTSFGLSVTGIAGPSGGSREKPVGLVYFGLAGAGDVQTDSSRFQGDRKAIKFQASQKALDMLRRHLMSAG